MKGQKKRQWMKKLVRVVSFRISMVLSLLLLVFYAFLQPELRLFPSLPVVDQIAALFEIIEAKTLDIRFWLRGPRSPGDDIVIVAVDEKTEDELGRWQSSGRRWIAEFVHILHQEGANVVGFDLTLAEPDEGAVLEAMEAVKAWHIEQEQGACANLPEVLAYLDGLKTTYNYDRQLQQAIQEAGNVILGIYHFWSPNSAAHLTPETHDAYQQLINRAKYTITKFYEGITPQPLRLMHSYGVEPNLPIFSEAARSFGHFNALPSSDGYIRYFPMIVEYMGEYYPSLNLEMARAALHPSPTPIIYAWGKEGGGNVDFIQLGKIALPTDEQGKLLINFYGPGHTFPHYSLSDMLLQKIPPGTFRDKIVLLGFTSAIYQDLHSISFEQDSYPGVEVHATIIENILRQDFLTKPEWTILLNALIILLLGIVLGIALHRSSPYQGTAIALACLLIVAALAYAVFLFYRIWLNVTFPLFFIVIDYLMIVTHKYFTEERRKKQIKQVFQHYVSPRIVDQILENVEELKLGGERKQLTVFFSDIRGFTTISETLTPEELVRFLNEYLSAMTKIVLAYDGTVDKYIGDAIMAFYGAPIQQADHAVKACRTALDMIARLNKLDGAWKIRDLPPIRIGIGMNTGEMSIGNMGSEERFEYTVMGDHVNLASRLEGLTKEYGTDIVMSQFTYEVIRNEPFIIRELDSVRVKGKREPVTIYELKGYGVADERTSTLLEMFADGLKAYKNRQWEQAIKAFQEIVRLHPDDGPSQTYNTRCKEFMQNPPPGDWDGVFDMKMK